MKWLNNKFSPLSYVLGFACITASVQAADPVTIQLNSEKQTIRGFGGMTHRVWTGYDLNESDRDLAFGNGPGQMGLSVLRVWASHDPSQWPLELATAKAVIAKGGIVYASPWNPPTALRTPYTLVRWGTSYQTHKVAPENYSKYVDHLNQFAKYMKDNGAPLYAISMQNEPDWCDSWTCWSDNEVYNFVKSHASNLRLHGTKVISAESFAYNKSLYNSIIEDETALNNIDILGTHFYGSVASTPDTYFQYPLADEKASHKERWMTEHYTDSKGNANMWKGWIVTGDQDMVPKYDSVRALDVAYEIHRAMVEGNFNQYTWWYIRRNYGLIMHDTQENVKPNAASASEVGKVTKRGYCMAQYSKFVRPGFVRVEATKNPVPHLYISAYKKADSVVIVAVNRAGEKTIDINIPEGSSIQTWKKFTTSATKNVQEDSPISANGGSFSVTFDTESVTTLVGVGTPPPVVPQAPFHSTPFILPGKIEAEDYDVGGEGVSYHDTDLENKGNVYRTDAVDITGNATDGFQLGWTQSGEWLNYTVEVTQPTAYQWEARVASGADNASFRILLNETDITGLVEVPKTGDWSTYTTITGTTPPLESGVQNLQILIEGSYLNLDWIQFQSQPPLGVKHQLTRHSHSTDYHVFDLQGNLRGSVHHSAGTNLQAATYHAIHSSGIFILKPLGGGPTQRIAILEP